MPGLYIHIPFCLSRCGYCAFTSGIYDEQTADAYLKALREEWTEKEVPNTQFDTVFIGGGTPSCLSMRQLETLLSLLPEGAEEITCEMNPDTTTKEKLRLLAEGGVNRVSFGVQTFSPEGLRLLGRRHDANAALRAIDRANEVGFPKGINIDLINEWPGQTESLLRADAAMAVSLSVQHISCYNFILEEQAKNYTAYSEYKQNEDEEKANGRAKKYWEIIEETLENAGFIHYETSNFSKEGFACRHNAAIWQGGEYIGIGLAAHSHRNGRRFANTDDMETYLAHSADPHIIETFSEQLTGEAKARECAVFWLRLFEGVHLARFVEKTGHDFRDLYKAELPKLLSDGIMETTPSHIRVAKQYHPLLDMILTDLV